MPRNARADQRTVRAKRDYALARSELRAASQAGKPVTLTPEELAQAEREGRITRIPPKKRPR